MMQPVAASPGSAAAGAEGRADPAFWRMAALGFPLLVAFNAFLLLYAWLDFAHQRPDYFSATGWPTFSRALSHGDAVLYGWLAAVAGAGLFIGSASVAAMRRELAAHHPQCRGRLIAGIWCAAFAALLGIVHYFHVTISLSVDNGMHMLLSYIFFFGMTGMIVIDWLVSRGLPLLAGEDPAISRRFHSRRAMLGPWIIAVSVLFLLSYVLKDFQGNPWADATRKVFVGMEAAWIILAHWYALLYVAPVRAHFRRPGTAAAASAAPGYAGLAVVLLLVSAAPDVMAASPGGLGGSGRIQPAGGVLDIVGPAGQTVERVAVRAGARVRKGALILVTTDRTLRALERDHAADRLRLVQQQAIDGPAAAELEAQAARLTLDQARAEAQAIAALDDRTVPARERRRREAAVAQAELALKAAMAKRDAARASTAAEVRLAQRELQLADAALERTRVLAPMDATVLQIHVQPGSALGNGPAVSLADTSRMYVLADFFEGDLPRLQVGQRAEVSNAAFGSPIVGTVERIGRVIEPVNRLARVWIRLARPAPADRFIGMQVDVKVAGGQAGGSGAR